MELSLVRGDHRYHSRYFRFLQKGTRDDDDKGRRSKWRGTNVRFAGNIIAKTTLYNIRNFASAPSLINVDG